VHDHAVALSSFASDWTPDPIPIAIALVALVLFGQAFLRLRRRGRRDHAPWTRAILFVAGIAVSVVPLVSPIDPLSDDYLLSVHMLEHVLIGDTGPALIVCALRGPLLVFMLPPAVLAPLARSQAVRGGLGWLTRPRVSLLAWAIVMASWHVPRVYDFAVEHQTVHDLEHLSFAIVGVLVWMQLIDPTRHGRLRVSQRLLFALVIFALGQLLADVFILTFRPLYSHYADQPARVMGIAPLTDQRIAGFVMMGEQAITLGTCALLLYRRIPRMPAGAVGARSPVAPAAGDTRGG
jgi:putative membrane protein